MRVAICEDEVIQQNKLIRLIEEWGRNKQMEVGIDIFVSSEDFITQYDFGKLYHIVFMDIHLKGMDGVKASRKIRERDESIIIVFTTSRMEYVLQGYEVNAWRFLLKPLHASDVILCMNKALECTEKMEDNFLVKEEGKLFKIPYQSIYYFEAFGHYVTIATKTKRYTVRMTLTQLEQTLPKEFYRSHRSYIINLVHCTAVEEQQVLIGDRWITISNKKKKELIENLEGIASNIVSLS